MPRAIPGATGKALGFERNCGPGPVRVLRAMLLHGLPRELLPPAAALVAELEAICLEQREEEAAAA